MAPDAQFLQWNNKKFIAVAETRTLNLGRLKLNHKANNEITDKPLKTKRLGNYG